MTLGGHLSVGLPAIAAIHGYLWFRLVRGTTRSTRARVAGGVLFAGLAALIPIALISPPRLGPEGTKVFFALAYGWLGLCLLLVMTTALTEPVRMVAWLGRVVRARRRAPSDGPAEPVRDEKRRRVLSQALGGAAAALGLATAVAGRREADALRVVRVRAPLRRLPEAMSGTRIAQITDLHFGGSIGPEYLARVVEMVNALEPDLVAITGDLVDGPARTVAAGLAPLAGLRARHGVFYVTGNHEYYHGAAEWVVALSKLGVRVLSNERVEVGEPGASFDLAGVHDRSAAHYRIGHTQDLPAALAGRDPEREVVLLAHQPVIVRDAAKHDVGLVLSGHTHGGQLAPYKFALLLEQPFVDGLHRLGDTLIYVSRGAGYWGPKLRVLAPPEIAEITLLRA